MICDIFHSRFFCVQLYRTRPISRHQSPKLKTGHRYENRFWNPGFTNEVRQFCGYQYLCYEQLASCGSQLQQTCGTIGIMRITSSINLRNNWHHADHNFKKPAEQLASCGSQLQKTCGTIGICLLYTSPSPRD